MGLMNYIINDFLAAIVAVSVIILTVNGTIILINQIKKELNK